MFDIKVDLVRDSGLLGSLNRLRAEECSDRDDDKSNRDTTEHCGLKVT